MPNIAIGSIQFGHMDSHLFETKNGETDVREKGWL